MKPAGVLLVLLGLGGCMIGPDYKQPTAPIAVSYKELAGWQPAAPRDAHDRGAWWLIYHDPLLDQLERQIDISNYTLKQAEANYRNAQAIVQEAQANLFPLLSAGGTFQRTGVGGGTSVVSSGVAYSPGFVGNQYTLQGTGSWDLDVWGEIRRQVASDVDLAQYSAAEIANARLSAQAALATAYFNLRGEDSLASVLESNVKQFTEALRVTENEYHAGYVARGDVLTAQTELQTTQAELIAVGVARAQYEHAIAVQIGKPPAELSIGPGALPDDVPVMPPSLPSALLQRRPDIAAAERQMAAENELIGVALAAFFPQISLSSFYGYTGPQLANLIALPNRIWGLGAAFNAPLFEGGAQIAAVVAARANYDAAVANYRQTVLTAFQQVEDELVALRVLAEEKKVQDVAVKSAQDNVAFAFNEYKAGTVIYTTVLTDQELELSDEITDVSIQQSRMVASVALIEALGGGFASDDLPSTGTIRSPNFYLPGNVLGTKSAEQ